MPCKIHVPCFARVFEDFHCLCAYVVFENSCCFFGLPFLFICISLLFQHNRRYPSDDYRRESRAFWCRKTEGNPLSIARSDHLHNSLFLFFLEITCTESHLTDHNRKDTVSVPFSQLYNFLSWSLDQ